MKAVEFPKKLGFLFEPHPYKVAHGGRNGFKSWGFARAILTIGASRPVRVLCAREVQNSIKESVHQLLKDQVERLGFGDRYEVLDREIRGRNGTNIVFTGLSSHTVSSIKSYEAIDICWVEEGQTISERSWEILDPTIRKPGSEIWISFNAALETDPTFEMFVTNPPPGTVVVKIGYQDAPAGWFTEEMEAKRAHSEKTNPKNYPNIWEGECLPAVEGAIYFEEVQQMERDGRICDVPYDPMLKVHQIWDIGWDDSMSIGMVQRQASAVRIINYMEGSHRRYDEYSNDLKELRYNWGKVWMPCADGFSKNPQTGMGGDQILRAQGWKVAKKPEIRDVTIEGGIKETRLLFPRIYVDKTKCARLIECWKRYQRVINTDLVAGAPMRNEWAHGADMTRYIATNIASLTNDTDRKPRGRVATYEAHL